MDNFFIVYYATKLPDLTNSTLWFEPTATNDNIDGILLQNMDNYRRVKTFEGNYTLDQIYNLMQGEVWSPNGEGRELIQSLGLNHTSMSMGDIIYSGKDKEFWMVMPSGFSNVIFLDNPAII